MTDSRVAIIAGVSSGTKSATEITLAMKRAKVMVAAAHYVKEGTETVCPIREAESGDIFVNTNVANEEVIRSQVGKPAKTYGGIVYAFDNTGIERIMTPVSDLKSGRVRSTVFENMESMNLIGGVRYPAEIVKAAIGQFSDKASDVPGYASLADGEFVSSTNTLQI
jgi:NAD(P)-dependent dehydrogenase (short-subunit alcohol dehydrogenase family)